MTSDSPGFHQAWGHTAHRGWARLFLNRARDIINHGPVHRGANGAAMPTDEGDQDDHFLSLPAWRNAWLLRHIDFLAANQNRGR